MNSIVSVGEDLVTQAGGVVYWRMAGDVDPSALQEEWEARNLDTAHLPTPPGPDAALRRALAEFQARRVLVRPLAHKGQWTLVEEHIVDDGTLRHAQTCTAKLDALGRLRVEPEGDLSNRIFDEYVRHLTVLTPQDISAWVIDQVERLGAVSLRDRGGVYFVPRSGLTEWNQIVAALRACSDHRFYQIPAMPTEDVVTAVLDAVREEAEQAAAAIEAEVANGDLKSRALTTRADRCTAVAQKIATYEALLGTKMEDLRRRFDDLQASIAVASLAAMGGA